MIPLGTLQNWVETCGAMFAIDVFAKITLVLLAAGGLVAWGKNRWSAAVRHLVWVCALAILPVVPVLSLCFPGWEVLPRWETPTNVSSDATASVTPARPSTDAVISTAPEAPHGEPPLAATEPTVRNVHARLGNDVFDTEASSRLRWSGSMACGVWGAGFLFAMVPVWLGLASLKRLELSSVCVEKGPLAVLTRRLAAGVGTRRGTTVLLSAHREMPMQWGVFWPRVLVPAAARRWPESRLQAALLHELAHVRRWDCLTRLVSRVVCALYWFHPLVWWAMRRLRSESETACDDLTLAAGCRPADYAEHILRIAADCRSDRVAEAMAIGMAHPSQLEGRLVAILDHTRCRGGLTRMHGMACVFLLIVAGVPLSMLRAGPLSMRSDEVRSANGLESGAQVVDTRNQPIRLGYVDSSAESKRSIAGSGHAVEFQRPKGGKLLMAIEIFASRYGTVQAPAEDFHVYVLDEDRQLIQACPFPYSMIERGSERWYTLRLPAVKVPRRFYVALAFNPHRTKGVYLGLDESVDRSHSLIGRPTRGYRPMEDSMDWMVRAVLVRSHPPQNPFDGM